MIGFILRLALLCCIFIIPQYITTPQAHASEEKADNAESSQGIYLTIPPFSVTMYHNGRPKGNMTITLVIKLVDDKKRALAQKKIPFLTSSYMIEANRLSYRLYDTNRPVSAAMLGDTLQLATNKVLGHQEARLLLSDIVVKK